MSKRLEANLEILSVPGNLFMENPDQHFGQALANLDIILKDPYEPPHIIDPYHMESKDILKRAKAASNKIKELTK
jgi:hypothetical protein